MAGKKNKTQRDLEARIRAFRARTGGDYASAWISPETFALLPEAFRQQPRARRTIDGVPLKILEVIPRVGF